SEANETALRLARAYHVDRGEPDRWRVISPAQAYHGSTMATLALTGRTRTLQDPYAPYLSPHLHVGNGDSALSELDQRLEEAGPGNVAAFFCEPISGVLCKQHVYDAIDRGSRFFDLGHTWDGAPISCATGLAVLDALAGRGLVQRVRERGPRLLADLRSAVEDNRLVAEVRGRGFLLGVSLVDLPDEMHADERVEDAALNHGLLVSATHSTADGYAGD